MIEAKVVLRKLEKLKHRASQNLSKYDLVEKFFGSQIERRLLLEHWYFNELICRMIFDKLEVIQDILSLPPEYDNVLSSIRKGLPTGYRFDDQTNDTLQEVVGLKHLITNGFKSIDVCRKIDGVPRPDFIAEKGGSTWIVEVKNVPFKPTISNLILTILNYITELYDRREYYSLTLGSDWDDFRLSTDCASEYVSQLEYFLSYIVSIVNDIDADEQDCKDTDRTFPAPDAAWLRGRRYSLEASASGFGFHYISGGRDPFCTIPTDVVDRASSKFQSAVERALNEQCRPYRRHVYDRSRSCRCMVLVNVEIDEYLVVQQTQLTSRLKQIRETLMRKHLDLDVLSNLDIE